MGSLDHDDKVLDELRTLDIEGFTPRGKVAVQELANNDHGAMIFLILSLHSRIRDLEQTLDGTREATAH